MAKETKEEKDRIEMAYALLAAAIIKDGQDANDTIFLKSKWYKSLKEMVCIKLNKKKYRDTFSLETKQ